jgi:transposase
MDTKYYVGIDVAKDHLDVAVRPNGGEWTIPNDEKSAMELAERLKEIQPKVVVMEATGGYEMTAASELAAAGSPVAVINPRQA